jgi:hypothetical protein
VGVLITIATIAIGLMVGTSSGYFGGLLDEALMRVVEIFMGFPFLLAAITLAAVLGTSPRFDRITTGMIALIAFGWTTYARLLRGDILSVKERDYVMAARTLGASHLRIMMRREDAGGESFANHDEACDTERGLPDVGGRIHGHWIVRLELCGVELSGVGGRAWIC